MEFTQKEMLGMLKESGRNKWNVRQMIALRKEGYLPPLTRKTQPGTNKPLNVWDETVINQIVYVYDWWDYCKGDRTTLAFALWLKGYKVPFDLLRRTYITFIEALIQKLTGGKKDSDDILDKVSEIVAMWMRKLKYTPGLADQRKKMSIEQMEMYTETVLSALAVPDQEVATEFLHSSLLDARESQKASIDNKDFITQSQDVAVILRDIFALPHLREAIITATLEQWGQAREDYQSICLLLSEFEKLSSNGDTSVFAEDFLRRNLTMMAANFLIVPLLSTRYHGYGQYIDVAFEEIHELLVDPEFQEQIFNKHLPRRTIEADVEDIEKPELTISE